MLMDLVRRFSNRNPQVSGARLPPGQTLVSRWPVLTYGSTPPIDLATWRFEITGLVEEETRLSWSQLMALPQTTIVSDAHCVTGKRETYLQLLRLAELNTL